MKQTPEKNGDGKCSPRIMQVGDERVVVMTYRCYQQIVATVERLLKTRRFKGTLIRELNAINNNIRAMRQRKGITIPQLAKRLRVTPTQVRKLERPEVRDLTLQQLGQVAKALRCPVHELIA